MSFDWVHWKDARADYQTRDLPEPDMNEYRIEGDILKRLNRNALAWEPFDFSGELRLALVGSRVPEHREVKSPLRVEHGRIAWS